MKKTIFIVKAYEISFFNHLLLVLLFLMCLTTFDDFLVLSFLSEGKK